MPLTFRPSLVYNTIENPRNIAYYISTIDRDNNYILPSSYKDLNDFATDSNRLSKVLLDLEKLNNKVNIKFNT